MKYIFILIASIVLSAIFHYMFGEADWIKRGLFIGLCISCGGLYGAFK